MNGRFRILAPLAFILLQVSLAPLHAFCTCRLLVTAPQIGQWCIVSASLVTVPHSFAGLRIDTQMLFGSLNANNSIEAPLLFFPRFQFDLCEEIDPALWPLMANRMLVVDW